MRLTISTLLLAVLCVPEARAQTPDDIAELVERCLDLDSTDLIRSPVKFRAGLEPSLLAFDADESGMIVLDDPRQVHGRNEPFAAGWYRIRFSAPEKLGRIARPAMSGYALGIESNVIGSWEIYTYVNGKRAGHNGTGAIGAPRFVKASNEPPHIWRSNAQLYANPGDEVTVVILATCSPFAEGSAEGYGLRHLRLRFAGSHTSTRQAFFGGLGPSPSSGLLGVRDRLARSTGDDLKALQERFKAPLAGLDALFEAAETENLETFSRAMGVAGKEINDSLRR